MNAADTYVRARIDAETKARATEALEAMGLSISDAIRLLMLRIADERRLPFEVNVPNSATRKALVELESGRGKKFRSVKALMADLHADDGGVARSLCQKSTKLIAAGSVLHIADAGVGRPAAGGGWLAMCGGINCGYRDTRLRRLPLER